MSNQIQPYETPTTDLAPMAPVNAGVLDQMKSYAEAWGSAAQIAEQIARTDFAGPFKGKPADLAVAILKGTSIGIQPADIGKAIYVVHGTPALYGKTALAIALNNGYIAETIEDTPKAVTVRMTAPHGQQMEVRYTIERATQEGLVKGNKVQYETRPSKMLYWKCIGELTDRMIPHLTGGMPIKEDVEQSPVRMQATRTDEPARGGRGRAGLTAALAPAPADVVDDPLSAALAEIQDTTDRDLLEGLVEKWAGLVTTDDEVTAVAEAGRQRWTELAAEQMDNEHE